MRNILLILTIAFSISSNAQGNLQYDSTLTITGSLTDSWLPGNTVYGSVYTVPTGKTWKLESAVFSVYGSSYNFTLLINSKPFSMNSSILDYVKFPIWLKAGDTVQVGYDYASGSSNPPNTEHFLLSILQFNVVP